MLSRLFSVLGFCCDDFEYEFTSFAGVRNILLDNGGQFKVAGFCLIRLSKILVLTPEFTTMKYLTEADSFSFGFILYEFGFHGHMVEGIQPFHLKPQEEVARAICVEGKRPPFKIKSESYPPDLKD
uniref:Uncharacterized protein n=1 Tax=Cucumis melo TaxID=3656 RepID=A0A9I9EFE8_CUCME